MSVKGKYDYIVPVVGLGRTSVVRCVNDKALGRLKVGRCLKISSTMIKSMD